MNSHNDHPAITWAKDYRLVLEDQSALKSGRFGLYEITEDGKKADLTPTAIERVEQLIVEIDLLLSAPAP